MRMSEVSTQLRRFDEHGQPAHQEKTLKVSIPAGVTDGERLRLKGQGAPGIGDAPPGDLYLHIKFAAHPLYVVGGKNLTISLPVAPWEAVLGARLEVPTLDGSIKLTVPANSRNGQRLRIKGKGLGKAAARGDLFVVLCVSVPDQVSESEQVLWQQLAELSNFDPRQEWGK